VPDRSKFGGLDVSIKDEFSSIVMDKYKFTSTNKVEILWLEVSTNSRKYIVAGIYRHPNKDIGSGVYAAVGRLSVCRIQPLLQVCCCGPGGQEIVMDCCSSGGQCRVVSVRMWLVTDLQAAVFFIELF